jgi:hypothetical protein
MLLFTGCDSRDGDNIDYEITSMTVDPDFLYADRNIATYSDVRVTVEDNEGYPAAGIAVSFQADLGYIQGKVYTDDYGVASTQFNDNGVVGMAHITASISGEPEEARTDSIEVRSSPHIRVTRIQAHPGLIYLDNGITSSNIEVLVKDQAGFPATGETVYFQTDIGNIINNVKTDSSGIASTTFC